MRIRHLFSLAAPLGLIWLSGCDTPASTGETTSAQTAITTTPTNPGDSFPGRADHEAVIDRLIEFDGMDLLTVAHVSAVILAEEGFPPDWWGRYNQIVVDALDLDRYPRTTPVSVTRGGEEGSMMICIGDECHEMILFGSTTKQIAVDGVVIEQLVTEAPEGFLVYGWCSPDTIYAYGYTPDQSPLPFPGQSDLLVYNAQGPTTEFVVDIDRQALAVATPPPGWTVACE